ncbi:MULTISPECIES: TetR/AcrR family transcriptional regulator [Luteibacter]|uniref:TetR/AcrR family transcriptional regulator n=1 Tax=Luteibacter flocculans TaxID=2780091 RepID=A0ABY4SZF8_9GAMM|nr:MULTISPECIES: TetR/AcrR family transcriptional regulator [Luteibacter]URL58076.1 TetR/AcrR family transcriptional regulator [Luteibacter flocculans]SFW73523.1 transcriptional regulator, TetR family [Luteibacter sp. UNCMF366Tsu5.1]
MNASPKLKTQGPGRPKDMEKRAAILDAAKSLFTQGGFAGTSMDAVAASAGVSKLTVYSHFGDKDNLFREVIRSHVQERLPDDLFDFTPGSDIRTTLTDIASRHAAMETNSESVGTFRAILSDCQSGGNPRFGRLVWEEGPARMHKLMQRLLEGAASRGQLDIPDVSRATTQLLALLKGDLLIRRLFGCEDCAVQFAEEVNANALAAVDMFMRAYSPRHVNV